MRKIIVVLLVTLFCFSQSHNLALADGMIIPEALSPDYLTVRYHHVTVTIENGHAVTQVEQEFYNPYTFPISGRYLFPVPPEVILSDFRATIDGQAQRVIRQDPMTTNTALYDTIAQRHDPTLLQYADWETLALDMNLPPGGSQKMSLKYEEVLVPSGGLYRYRYVLSTERYSATPLAQVSLTVNLHTSSGLASLYSSTHPIVTEWRGSDRARVTWQAENVRPTEDFELFFAPADGGFGGGLLTGQRNGHDHFLFLFSPETVPVDDHAIPKDIVFVIDRSGSMGGEKIEQARNALHFILGQLAEADRFSIVGFDHRLSLLAQTAQPVAQQTLTDARWFVDSLTADGNTDLDAALQAGLEILNRSKREDAAKIIVFLTDGLPTAGITDEALIAHRVSEANPKQTVRLHVFGVGYDVNTHLLDQLAVDNGGTVTYVQPRENLEAVLSEFYRHIAHPVLTDVTITFEGVETSDMVPQRAADLFQGSSLLLTGRYRAAGDTVTVRVRGQAGDEAREYVYSFDLDQTGDHDFVPRLWATRRVGELLDRVRVEGENQALVAEIRDLGLSYGLVTPYTTFIIEAQAEGAASTANMALYNNPVELNRTSGQTTIQARVQNQAYQQASQATQATGANVLNYGQRSLAQLANQTIDLSLLQDTGREDLNSPLTAEWISRNIRVDRTVPFGSKAYFALAADPTARPFLQSGTNVIFSYNGKVIAVQDDRPIQPQETKQEGNNGRSINAFIAPLLDSWSRLWSR